MPQSPCLENEDNCTFLIMLLNICVCVYVYTKRIYTYIFIYTHTIPGEVRTLHIPVVFNVMGMALWLTTDLKTPAIWSFASLSVPEAANSVVMRLDLVHINFVFHILILLRY